MPCSSVTEASVSWFRLASGAVRVGVSCVGSPEPAVVSSSSASSAKRTCSTYVHWNRHVVHAARRIRGVEAIWVLLVIERPVWVALEVSLKVCECAATKSSRLELWTWDIGRIAALLFQYIVKKLLASGHLYGALFQLGEVASLGSFDYVF